jgi:hypothetical protein
MKIRTALTHQNASIMIPGVISSERTLNTNKVKGIKMDYDDKNPHVLKIKVGKTKALIPLTNFQVLIIDEDGVDEA